MTELQVTLLAAKEGAKRALYYFDKSPKVTIKPDNTPVTKADLETEAQIKQIILQYFPNSSFLGEESGGNIHDEELWVIDPIDGTRNYIRGLPFWGVEIAFVKNGQPVIGVSYSPCLNELMYAQEGKGAYLNEKKATVSGITTLSDAVLNHGTLKYYQDSLPQLLSLASTCAHQRGYGDFYGYHLVASGRSDIMLDAKNGPWDIAALKIIIEEAGGKVTNFKGNDWTLSDKTAVATNGLIHAEVVRILNKKN